MVSLGPHRARWSILYPRNVNDSANLILFET
jgi:hypothetical protein